VRFEIGQRGEDPQRSRGESRGKTFTFKVQKKFNFNFLRGFDQTAKDTAPVGSIGLPPLCGVDLSKRKAADKKPKNGQGESGP
jgi:hypothetical protein